MTPDVDRQSQRSHTNLYRFRRLKWGGPPSRFKLVNVLRARPQPDQPSIVETTQELSVVQLDRIKHTWSSIDVALLVCIGISCFVIAIVLMS